MNDTERVMAKYMLSVLLLLGILPGALRSQGSILLVGGGTENYNDWSDTPYRWLVTHAPNRKIAVLHYSDTTTFFSGYFPWLSPCAVSNRPITSTVQANDSVTYRFILEHDGIFLRGGDQGQYVRLWRGTLTQQAIREVFQRGGVVGGTSAGEMALSEVMFSAGTANPWSLLQSPASSITLVDDFLALVPDVLAESHTNERGRIGRLPVFLARYKSAHARDIAGVAVDANTALAVGSDGIGEVMGGSAVTVLRWKSGTNYVIESGRSFSLSDMALDQLLPGFKINLQTGSVLPSASATGFTPKQTSFPGGAIILDGSGNGSDWSASGGSLRRLQSALGSPGDVVGIFSSPAAPGPANTVNSTLSSWGVVSNILWIDETRKDDPSLAATTASCGAFVFAGNSLDSLARILDPVTGVGRAFAAKVGTRTPLLFLSEDVMLAGEKAIGGLYSSVYSAYYGTLTQLPGLNLLKGMQPVPRFYQNPDNTVSYDYSENRIMGMLWSMGQSQLPYGLLIDAGSYVTVTNGTIEIGGISLTSTPAILVDARNTRWRDFPVFHRPGKPNAVQNAALVGATMHILRTGDSFSLLTDVRQDRELAPHLFFLEQSYPNPFNPVTTIRFSISEQSRVSLNVYDLLGREVAVLVDQQLVDGTYEKQWDASRCASGVYFAKLDQIEKGSMRTQTTKLVVTK